MSNEVSPSSSSTADARSLDGYHINACLVMSIHDVESGSMELNNRDAVMI